MYGECEIGQDNRRQCSSCRLKKCFEVGMKEDWIRTDKERQLRELIKTKQLTDEYQLVRRKKRRVSSMVN